MDGNNIQNKKKLFSKINRKITLLFIIVGLIAPSIAIFYFYNITVDSMAEEMIEESATLLRTIAIMIIVLIAINAGVIIEGITTDYEGNNRNDRFPDIGAFEFVEAD